MKIIFMGTPDFSVGTLEALIEAGHEVCLVVTQPDKPKGRGKEMQFTPVKAGGSEAWNSGVSAEEDQGTGVCGRIKKISGRCHGCDCIWTDPYQSQILEMTPYGCINVHASLLPKYRGAAPIQWAVIDGEEVTGVTTMQMDEGLDTGDMILKDRRFRSHPDETGGVTA